MLKKHTNTIKSYEDYGRPNKPDMPLKHAKKEQLGI